MSISLEDFSVVFHFCKITNIVKKISKLTGVKHDVGDSSLPTRSDV